MKEAQQQCNYNRKVPIKFNLIPLQKKPKP